MNADAMALARISFFIEVPFVFESALKTCVTLNVFARSNLAGRVPTSIWRNACQIC
jgi:hypothetical protein